MENEHCAWCPPEASSVGRTQDHVFPDCLGGKLTEGIWVPSCSGCQSKISQAERTVGRDGPQALERYARGARPRHPKRPESGRINASFLIVKNPETKRYSNCSLRLGEAPTILPAVELNLDGGDGFLHGSVLAEVDGMLTKVVAVAQNGAGPDGRLADVQVDEFELLRAVAADPEFHPRLYLAPSGTLRICARNESEVRRFSAALIELTRAGAFSNRDHSAWGSWTIPAQTSHPIVLTYRHEHLLRVIVKMGYGLLLAWRSRTGRPRQLIPDLAAIIRGDIKPPATLVTEMLSGGHGPYPDGMSVVVCSNGAAVGIFGRWYLVQLQSSDDDVVPALPIGAICPSYDPQGQRWLTSEETARFVSDLGLGRAGP